MTEQQYCKRLIEVDLPIKRISEHARHEKSIRHGHISTLHIWWARRPLAACRAVICAALWPDPVDPLCPAKFKTEAARLMREFRDLRGGQVRNWNESLELRQTLLDFIADFANGENAIIKDYLEISDKLTKCAHEALGGETGTRPLVVDLFAGGGAIPLEALRVGADVFASDLNPIPVLLNKIILGYIPQYGQRLPDEVRKWAEWIKTEFKKEFDNYYLDCSVAESPIAFLWARTIRCEGPNCGVEIPLIRSLWLAHKGKRSTAVRLIPNLDKKRIEFEIIKNVVEKDIGPGTVKRSAAVCPLCGYTTSAQKVRDQFKGRSGGANDARLYCVVTTRSNQQGRFYRLPNESDFKAFKQSKVELKKKQDDMIDGLSIIPNEELPYLRSIFNIHLLDVNRWGDLFNSRQALAISTLVKLVRIVGDKIKKEHDGNFAHAVQTCLAIAVSKSTDMNNSLCTWRATSECVDHLFARQAMGITWDYAEAVLTGDSTGSWESMFTRSIEGLESAIFDNKGCAQVGKCSAVSHPLPDHSAHAFVTDPPYYDAVPYADLSDFFYVWLRRMIGCNELEFFKDTLTPKEGEIVQLAERNPKYSYKTHEYFETLMTQAMSEGRRILSLGGIGIVVFAHKSTSGWEAQLEAMIRGGWIITGSWPIDTEMGSRLRAMNSAVLASSIHLVCRPRDTMQVNDIGDWRDVLQELPKRIHEWMPRLAEEGVVGADAIFACLGPALEIFSRYSHVEKANGEKVALREYLEYVWAAVAKEALNMIFKGARTEGFEEDARLTAMWLWTLSAGSNVIGDSEVENDGDTDNEGGTVKISGFSLEFDAARKIAQGLGVHLEELSSMVKIEGETARLLPVAERAKYLFGQDSVAAGAPKRKKKADQLTLDFIKEIEEAEQGWSLGEGKSSVGKTSLDRVHQSMLLFAAGRSEALMRFLVEEGVGKDDRFWRLAQALSALYPSNTDEKRWVDGVLARKKSLGF